MGATAVDAGAVDIPHHRSPGVDVAVVAGSGWSLRSPIVGSSPLLEAEIRLDDTDIRIPAEHRERALIAISGDLRVAGQRLRPGQSAVLTRGEEVELHGSGRAMMLAGDPVAGRELEP